MFSIITTATHREVAAALGTGVGNRRIVPSVRISRDDPDAIIVTVPDWAGSVLTSALRRIGAWFDRAMPPGRVPTGRPIVSHAGASQVRKPTRREHREMRARKAA